MTGMLMIGGDMNDDRRIIAPEMIAALPEVVQRYLTFSGVVGSRWIERVRLKQKGTFRMGADRPWIPMTAEERYTVDPPTLTWNAKFRLFGLPLMRGRDHYEAGEGHMFGKLAGLFTIFDARGEQLNQATMVRYLNEIMWFPTAFLSKHIEWEAVDDHSAAVTFTDAGKSVSAVMYFDAEGRLTNFKTMRYQEKDGNFTLDPWATPVLAYGEFSGLKIPVRGQAVWHLEEGDLVYADLEISEVEYGYGKV